MTDEDVIDNYLIWQICKHEEDVQKRILEDSINTEQLKEVIEGVRQDYQEENYSLEEKKDKLRELDNNPDYSLKIFEECSWEKETVKVEDLGTTIPRLGDIPPEVITKTLPEVVEFVKNADPEEYRNVKYTKKLKDFHDVINQFYPEVVTPGNRPSKLDRMNRVHGEKDWNIKDIWGMITDGNHRTTAKILTNDLKEIECYVGYRQTE